MTASTCRAGIAMPIRRGIVLCILLAFTSISTHAQFGPLSDTAVPRKPIYGVGLDEFWIAARKAVSPPLGTPFWRLWEFSRPLNISTWELVNVPLDTEMDPLRNNARPSVINSSGHEIIERIVSNQHPLSVGGHGREVELYPFDSAVSYYWQNRFLARSGGESRINDVVDVRGLQERVYELTNTGINDTILKQMVYGYDPVRHQRRWDIVPQYDDLVQHTWEMTANRAGNDTFHIAVTGHLFSPQRGGGTANDNDSLLAIEIWNEVPWYRPYLDSNGVVQRNTAMHQDFLYHTVYVYKRDLKAQGEPPNYDEYRQIIIPVNMVRMPGSMGGPAYAISKDGSSASHRMDIRVRWTGKEKVAVRSIAVRDNLAQLMVGSRNQDISYRQNYINDARRILFGGFGSPANPAFLRHRDTAVIRFYTGDEGSAFTDIGYNAVDTLLKRVFPPPSNPIVPQRHVRAYRAQSDHQNAARHVRTTEDELCVETYMPDMLWIGDNTLNEYFKLPTNYRQVHAISEHNGGKYKIPLLALNRDSIELYTKTMQRRYLGHYNPGYNHTEYERFADALGSAAWSSRRTGRRLIQWPGYGTMSILIKNKPIPQWIKDTLYFNGRDTVRKDTIFRDSLWKETWFTRPPEESELRLMVNLGLAYGSRGIHHGWIGTQKNQYIPDPDNGGNPGRMRYYTDFGPVGVTTADTAAHYPLWILEGRNGQPVSYDSTYRDSNWVTHTVRKSVIYRDTLFDFFTGFSTRLREMHWQHNHWLPQIGAAMAKLQWRDGYSMHFTVDQPWMKDTISFVPQTTMRPFPYNEIIRDLTTRSRTGEVDAPGETYVEVGLFDKRYEPDVLPDGSTLDSAQEVHHVFLLNRRSFERPSDIDPKSERGMLMDSLAETRTLRFTVREHPDSNQHNFIHVHEVAPDLTPLPLNTTPRRTLDTILTTKGGTLELTLRPAGGTLLRIAYMKPGNMAGPGDLKFNGQRKFVYDGKRYHSVYWRKTEDPSDPTAADTVFYRRSLPLSDTSIAIAGTNSSLLWEPEYPVWPVKGIQTPMKPNRYPAVTVRSLGGDAVVASVVWTSANAVDVAPRQFVLLKEFIGTDRDLPRAQMVYPEVVDTLFGRVQEQWGTPVISRLDGGDLVVYADSAVGIIARLRRLGGSYGKRDSISRDLTVQWCAGQYPSVPPFAHIAGRDSSVAVVWQQSIGPCDGSGTERTAIMYERLVDVGQPNGDTLRKINRTTISKIDGGRHLHPSIDMTQNVWYGAEEGVTWESNEAFWNPLKGWNYRTWVHFSSLFTETARRWNPNWIWYDDYGNQHIGGNWHPLWDSIENVQQWTYNRMLGDHRTITPQHGMYMWFYPSTASLNARIDTFHTTDSVLFSLTLGQGLGIPGASVPMRQALVQWPISFVWPYALEYSFGGFHPSTSASLTRQERKHGVLYQADPGQRSPLYTTRQFFYGKGGRPVGYVADGRQVSLRIDAASHTGMSVRLHDIWVAGENSAGPVRMVARPDTVHRTDSFPLVQHLFTSETFEAHDSTTIGLELAGYFTGDSVRAAGMNLMCRAELVNAVTGVVVHLLDSFTVTAGSAPHTNMVQQDVDLLSGTYYVRLRMEPDGLKVQEVATDSRYSVEETSSFVDEETFGKLRRMDAVAGNTGRVSAWPNPAKTSAEIRFSVPSSGYASVAVYDLNGRELLQPVKRAMMEEGRYAVTTDLSTLPAGTYLVELRHGSDRSKRQVVERLVISR